MITLLFLTPFLVIFLIYCMFGRICSILIEAFHLSKLNPPLSDFELNITRALIILMWPFVGSLYILVGTLYLFGRVFK
jgi:hypothetical protein